MGEAAPGRDRRRRGAPDLPDGRLLNARTDDAALTRVAREEGGRLLALLADRLGDLDLAHDCLQEAYAKAAATWPRRGAPDEPAGWVYVVARNAGIDRLRRDAAAGRRVAAQARVLETGVARDEAVEDPDGRAAALVAEDAEVGDERLRLLLLCCHPSLSRETQVVLTLRLAGGLTTQEIASALLLPDATVQQRIVRAKRKIRAARIPLTIPADLAERAAVLTDVLALIFNEGYVAHSAAAGTLTRVELADQAIRLTAAAADALPAEPEPAGLLALQLFHRSREAARTDEEGALVRLADQDRTRWDRAMIARGYAVLGRALAMRRLGPWQVQALVAAEHTRATTDWARIVRYYDLLIGMTPGPVPRLSRAVAVAEVEGAAVGLAAIDAIEGLDGYHLLHAARADLLERAGEPAAARLAWERAAALATNPAEIAYAERRRRACGA
ncbi:sigma-70 family RNA polymerase sigma factor [Demequina sp. SYSU T00192]|uniref:Sigma-70 family RNA polymerase sigma factor n=1 Tax=Demequina litoralis TaxID=3051660 RepID=A0ABT8GA87_9MICO|nr:sigma-70 family RNA polymerase sigma factor [Demequina sp. SYSU T00192]MDN4475977.1 sigma-70 family RNA polymerase sigma factor [Demequina sp. SYSU T00192]